MKLIKKLVKSVFIIRNNNDADGDSICNTCSRFTSCENCPYS